MKRSYVIIALSITVGCFFKASTGSAQNVDINLLKSINPQNPNSGIMRGFTNSAFPVGAAVPFAQLVAGYINNDKKLQYKGWETVGSLAITVVVGEGLKYAINRQRPYTTYPDAVHPYDASETGKSFPSGHTAIAFATATSLALEYKKWYVVVPAYLWAAGVGYSRLYQGEHYPSDVLAGAVVGVGSAWLSNWLTKKVFKN